MSQVDSHWLICGPTGTGKSTLIETELMKRVGRYAVVGIFPHGGDVATRIARRMWSLDHKKLVWDSAGEFDKVLSLKRSLPSDSGNLFERRVRNDETKHRLIEAMLARRQQQNVFEMPLIEDGLARGLDLWLNQNPAKPEAWIQFAFRPESEEFNKMVLECSDPEARFRAVEVNGWTKMERLRTLLPAKRVIDGSFGNSLFLGRTDGSVSIGELIDQGKICLFEGSPKAHPSAIRFWFITIIHEVCRHVVNGAKRKVILVIDEANSWVLIDPYLCRMLAELRKFGLQIWISVQAPAFGDDQVLDEVLTNCNKIYCFRPQSQVTSELMGFLMGMPILDPYAIHWMEERWRQVHAGYIGIPKIAVTKGDSVAQSEQKTWNRAHTDGEQTGDDGNSRKSESDTESLGGSTGFSLTNQNSETHSIEYQAQFKQINQDIPHYFSANEQIMFVTGQLMRLQTGEVMVKDHGKVWPEKIQQLAKIQDLKALEDLKMKRIQAEIQKLPYFKKPHVPEVSEQMESVVDRILKRQKKEKPVP